MLNLRYRQYLQHISHVYNKEGYWMDILMIREKQ